MRSSIKPFVLPAAIACGFLFHDAIKFIAPLSPYLIFMMLLLTFTSIDLHKIRLTRLQLWLLLIQISVCWIPYVLLRGYSSDVAAGLFMCVFISTATAAPVVTKMLGGSVEMLVSYSLTSNLAFALLAPPFLSIISDTADVSVAATLLYIARGVLPLLLVPLLVAYLLGRYAPELRSRISRYSSLSFYLWALALLIVVGNAVGLALEQQGAGIVQFAALFVGSAVLCAVQFYAGRVVGRHYGDPISGAQGLGQKNTVLAIWVATSYVSALASLAPAAYILWQNIFNSWQLYRKTRREAAMR